MVLYFGTDLVCQPFHFFVASVHFGHCVVIGTLLKGQVSPQDGPAVSNRNRSGRLENRLTGGARLVSLRLEYRDRIAPGGCVLFGRVPFRNTVGIFRATRRR